MTLSRRTLLKSSAAIAPAIISASALANVVAASDRLNVGMIGCGKMANDFHIPQLLSQADVQVVAVCEVDATRRMHAKKRVETKYSQGKTHYKGCDTYVDFREVIARDDIDAVCIATPDHWHAIPIIEACKAGKDV
jgi:predicted dehydrogenase